MPVATATAIAIGGAVISGGAAFAQAEEQKDIAAASKRAEAARRRQQKLQADRARRRVLREEQRTAATSRANVVASGVSLDSSAAEGSQGQIANNAAFQVNAINQNDQVGDVLFQSSQDTARARSRSALFGSIGQVGSTITSNSTAIAGQFSSGSQTIPAFETTTTRG